MKWSTCATERCEPRLVLPFPNPTIRLVPQRDCVCRPTVGIDAKHERVDERTRPVVLGILSMRALFDRNLAGLPPKTVLQEEEVDLRRAMSRFISNHFALFFVFFFFFFVDFSFLLFLGLGFLLLLPHHVVSSVQTTSWVCVNPSYGVASARVSASSLSLALLSCQVSRSMA